MDFTKMHGSGNDFIIIEAPSWDQAGQYRKDAAFLCDRNYGIGADGLIITGPSDEADVFMRIFNPDGSEPEMCGNGIRCVAKYVYQKGLVDKKEIIVKTLAGVRLPELILTGNKVTAVRVDMGVPVFSSQGLVAIKVSGQEFMATLVSVGNPHCVVFVENMSTVPVSLWGPEIENHRMFPDRTNVEFVQVLNKSEIILRVWERGAGVTLACGTGACAALAASVYNNKTYRKAIVRLLGGDLLVEWDEDDGHLYMTGPAVEVFKGTVALESE